MKTILTALLFAAVAVAEVHERKVGVDGKHYLVKYDVPECSPKDGWSNCTVSAPATFPPGQSHYKATITVYVYGQSGDSAWLVPFRPFPGQWTEQGCSEDDPTTLVKYALEHKNDPKLTPPIAHIQDGSGGLSNKAFTATRDGKNIKIYGDGTIATPCNNCIWVGGRFTECEPGAVSLDPKQEGDTVVIRARVCRDDRWVPVKVRWNDLPSHRKTAPQEQARCRSATAFHSKSHPWI